MDEIHEQVIHLYMNWLMQRVIMSGVKKEDSVKKAAEIFMEDFSLFEKHYREFLK